MKSRDRPRFAELRRINGILLTVSFIDTYVYILYRYMKVDCMMCG